MNRQTHFGLCVVLLLLLSGCARNLSTDYGKSKGIGHESLNGFGTLRKTYERAGFRSRDVTRLSNRVKRTDVIVWTPQMLRSINVDVTNWMEGWLGLGNKTLVYILPDSGSEADYWTRASKLAPPSQRLEYRNREAKSINQRMRWQLARNQVASNGWFSARPNSHRFSVHELKGEWGKDFSDLSDGPKEISVEFEIDAFNKNNPKPPAAAPAAVGFGTAGTGPGAPNFNFPSATETTETTVTFLPLLLGANNPLVGEIKSDKWQDSRILVVAGGSLLTNFAFTETFTQKLAEKIIAESGPSSKEGLLAGFLTTSWNDVPVSETKPGVPKASGMELLTVWPLSLVTMHGVILGLIVCLMLLPIFGRPKKVAHEEHSDFGDHLDSVAALMNKTGGERYARARISEYMQRMRGETTGPWVIPEPPKPKQANISSSLKDRQSRVPAKLESGSARFQAAREANEESTTTLASTFDAEPSTTDDNSLDDDHEAKH